MSCFRAHPRSRGENERAKREAPGLGGSSPLTRGKQSAPIFRNVILGLIPAHAGKTTATLCAASSSRAHPRSRGENQPTNNVLFTRAGSSPLTRGKHLDRRPAVQTHGLIPAHAGKTLRAITSSLTRRAHPRSRGENVGSRPPVGSRLGSSPLTRGKLLPRLWPRQLWGLIPAHAGKTIRRPTSDRDAQAHPRSRGENTA